YMSFTAFLLITYSKISINPRTSVVNPKGKVWEVDNLYAADLSIFPTSVGVNPMVRYSFIEPFTTYKVLTLYNNFLDYHL
ncbi:hypothetical protein C2G38_2109662, partial [Gigaspora rosea]